jgi:hypothetical protein
MHFLGVAALPGPRMTEGRRRDDRDTAEGVHREQIVVTGNDDIGAAVHGKLQQPVVGWIAADRHALGDVHKFGDSEQALQVGKKIRGDLRCKSRPLQAPP